jgi:hypothetical protein
MCELGATPHHSWLPKECDGVAYAKLLRLCSPKVEKTQCYQPSTVVDFDD